MSQKAGKAGGGGKAAAKGGKKGGASGGGGKKEDEREETLQAVVCSARYTNCQSGMLMSRRYLQIRSRRGLVLSH